MQLEAKVRAGGLWYGDVMGKMSTSADQQASQHSTLATEKDRGDTIGRIFQENKQINKNNLVTFEGAWTCTDSPGEWGPAGIQTLKI